MSTRRGSPTTCAAWSSAALQLEEVPLSRRRPRAARTQIADEVVGYGPLERFLRTRPSPRSWSTTTRDLHRARRPDLPDRCPVRERSAPAPDPRQDRRPGRPPDRRVLRDGGRPAAGRLARQRDHPAALAERAGDDDPQVPPAPARPWRTWSALARCPPEMGDFIGLCVRARLNILVTGGTGSGKTTLLNITPDDLIQRLKEGKVYVPKQAERALEHYFSPGNLTALRELALRRTAERVDEQLLTHMQAHAIPGPWAAGERVLVCVSEDPARGRAGALRQAAGRPPARARGPRSTSRRRRSLQLTRGASATASPTPCGSPSARRRGDHRAGGDARIADDIIGFRARQQRHPDRHRQVDPLALVRDPARLGRARPGPAQPATSASTSSPATSSPASRPEEDGAHREGARHPSTSVPYAVALLAVAVALGVGEADPAAVSASRTSISCS